MATLDIRGLDKAFGDRKVLGGLDLAIAAGERIALLGASGSGKSTLLRIVVGFERADAGCVALNGQPVEGEGRHTRPEMRGVGYVAQDSALFPHLSVSENIGFGLGRFQRRDGRRVRELLAMVGLPTSYLDRAPQHLSGGEQQRVALARALARRPHIVLMDEPFSALDPATRSETRSAVLEALSLAQATALIITHDQAEAFAIGERVGVLRAGKIAQIAPPADLYWSPADADMARFLGEAFLLPGMSEGGHVHCALGCLFLRRSVADGPVSVMLRPEQIKLGAHASPLRASVRAATFLGAQSLIELELAAGLRISARVASHETPRLGEVVGVSACGPVAAFPSADPTHAMYVHADRILADV